MRAWLYASLRPLPRAGRGAALVGRRYSRFVQLSKRALPAAALGLLLLVAIWPRIETGLRGMRLTQQRLDLSEARNLQMVQARFTGLDRQNRPFVITADVARQRPKLDQLISLERPKGDLTATSGSWLELSANTGLYQPQQQLLDLFGNVALFQDNGNEFHSESAHLDMAAASAEGDAPVNGQGPFGTVTAEGFRILDRGDTIEFEGRTHLTILPRASGK